MLKFPESAAAKALLGAILLFPVFHVQVMAADIVEEAGLVDLTFQQDMQHAMRQIMSRISGSRSESPVVDEARVIGIADVSSDSLLAQTDSDNTAQFEITPTESPDGESGEDIVTLNFQAADINALINLVFTGDRPKFLSSIPGSGER